MPNGSNSYQTIKDRKKKEREETIRTYIRLLQVEHDMTGEEIRDLTEDAILWEEQGA
jgi:hypothetical protein